MALVPLSEAVTTTAFQGGIVMGPVFLYGLARRSSKICGACAITMAIVLLQAVILYFPSPGFLSGLRYNWLQKLVASLITLGIMARWMPPPRRLTWSALGKGVLVGLVFSAIESFFSRGAPPPTTETVLFQLTMPGLQEELLYRGLLLYLWDQALGRPWGSLVGAMLFTTGHTVSMHGIHPNGLIWLDLIVFSIAMCWLTYRTGSVWAAVVAHNVNNGVATLLRFA